MLEISIDIYRINKLHHFLIVFWAVVMHHTFFSNAYEVRGLCVVIKNGICSDIIRVFSVEMYQFEQ
jgi:hypothetical protein